MTQPLFFEPAKYLEKSAAQVDLPEDPNSWPQEILQELYKQVPYISDFEPHVTMDRVDAEKVYGLVHVEVSPQTEAQMGTPEDQLQTAGIRSIRIPVVIKNGKLCPFDILITEDSKMLPLTETRLRQSIFRPQAFDVTARTPGDMSMIGQLYPPYRQNYGFGGGGTSMSVGMGKEGSALEQFLTKEADAMDDYMAANVKHDRLGKKYKIGEAKPGMLDDFIKNAAAKMVKKGSVLKAILSTINEGDYSKFASSLTPTDIQAAIRCNRAAMSESLSTLSTYDSTRGKYASAIANFIRPDVIQTKRVEDGYTVKSANHRFWEPVEEKIDRRELVQRFGEKVALATDTEGAVTMTEGAVPPPPEEAPGPKPEPITQTGFYKVLDVNGGEHLGYVIAGLIDTNGAELPLSLFTNGSKAAVQTDIVGLPAGDAFDLPNKPVAQGAGFFYTGERTQIKATIPFALNGGSYGSPDGMEVYVGETFDGRKVEVSQQPNIQTLVEQDGRVLVPDSWKWCPLEASDALDLVSTEEEEPKMASAQRAVASVMVRCDGHTFSINGPALSKLAASDKNFLDLEGVMFLLAGLGVDQGYGVKKLGQAFAQREPIQVKIGRALQLADDCRNEAVKTAEAMNLPNLRRDLVKEALFIPDPIAVDTVLSLGFINPENLMTFISYLPVLEESQTRMCELLLAARLGLEAVSETALERAVRSTEEVLEGLKVLAFQGV